MKKREFALYKDDKLIAMGTIDELAKELGIKRETVMFYNTPSYKKIIAERDRLARLKGKRCKALVMVEIEDDEDEGGGEQ